MLNRLVDRFTFTRVPSRAAPQQAAGERVDEDSSWHGSSFDLARGLVVIEHRGAAPRVFSDTMPAFRAPGA